MKKDDKDQELDRVVIKEVKLQKRPKKTTSETFADLNREEQITALNQEQTAKLLKRQEKELQKIARAKAKVELALAKNNDPKKQARMAKKTALANDPSSLKKAARKNLLNRQDLKVPKEKEPKNYKLGTKEFPVKMVKEVSKVRWSTKQNLFIKFMQVIIFILVFAIIFYLVDLGFQELFTLMRVI